MLAAMALAPLAFGTGWNSVVVDVARLLTVYFAVCFALLLTLSLFSNRAWRLTPAPQWRRAYQAAGGRGREHPAAW
jgi:hypothetical protein